MKKLERSKTEHTNDIAQKIWEDQEEAPEVWVNDLYSVFVRRHKEIPGIESKVCHISFHRHDRRAVTDWRHMQWMKNQLVGPENEGCEIFPKESRLVDGANEYHIWVFEDENFGFPFGFFERIVTEKSQFGETQRKFPEARKPHDLKENEEKMKKLADQYKNK